MEHPLFKEIRNTKFETTSKAPVILEFDKEDELPEDILRKLFLEEIMYYKKKKWEQSIILYFNFILITYK